MHFRLLLVIAAIKLLIHASMTVKECCKSHMHAEELLLCVNDSSYSHLHKKRAEILMLSYATESIFDYTAYSYAINSFYAQRNGYDFLLFIPSQGYRYYINDERWNKVKILMNAMNKDEKYEYVCFLDADLIFIDFDFDLKALISNYLWADVIVSRDSETKNGIMNSGEI